MASSPRVLPRPAALVAVIAVVLGVFVAAPAGERVETIHPTVARDVTLQRSSARSISRSLTLPVRANLLGVSYAGGDATVSLRYRAAAGGWSAWKEIDTVDIGPDAWTGEGSGRQATEPVWVGTADRVMVRVESARGVRDVRLHTVNTRGDATPRSWLSRAFGAVTGWLRAPVAEAVPAFPNVISRAQWGADERWRRCCPRYAPTVEVAVVHHTATTNAYSSADAPAQIRAIYRYHRFALDYDDIAYNFIVDRYGRVYEGRAGGITKPVIAAHSEGMNTKTTGMALLGTFSSAYPTGSMMVALKKLVAWKMDVHHIPPYGLVQMTSGGSNKLAKGQTVWLNRVSGHRDVQATDCPGNRVYGQLHDVRTTAMKWGHPKFYINAMPRVIRPDVAGQATASMKVWMSGTLDWKIDFTDSTGNVKRSFTGKGSIAEASWDGRDALTGTQAQTGVGNIRIDAWDSTGKHATIADVPLYVVTTHPHGTVLDASGTVVYVEENGATRSVGGEAIYRSWFRSNESVEAPPAELTRYAPGPALGFREGTLVKTPDVQYWWIAAGSRRAFSTPATLSALGYSDAAAIAASHTDVQGIPEGSPIADASVHPEGAVVRDSAGAAWVLAQGSRRRVPSTAVLKSWYRASEVVDATVGDLALPEGDPISFRPGTLLQTPEGNYWIVSGGARRLFIDRLFMDELGYARSAAFDVPWPDIMILPYGTPVS